ncbi:hypothetical protein GX48_08181 [Paracoccidioides brasiliensis]|nr:hypothetical protein GX48_08181 [Paracoccidioides brasiliensis]
MEEQNREMEAGVEGSYLISPLMDASRARGHRHEYAGKVDGSSHSRSLVNNSTPDAAGWGGRGEVREENVGEPDVGINGE